MKKILMMTLIMIFAAGTQIVSAQITITLPKIPKFKKEKPKQEQPRAETATTDNRQTSAQPTSETSSASMTDCESDAVMRHHVGEIKKTQQEAEEFRPGLRDYYVSTLSDRKNKYLEAALLPSERKEWAENWKNSPEFVKCIEPALDALAAAARKTLPAYTGPAGYTFGTPAEKKALLSAITDIAQAKVHKVGIKQANWLIDKDSYNFPTARYKHGVIWAKYPNQEFCWIFWVNLVQDYAGGGTYGASTGNYVSRGFAGCPAGAK